MASGQPVKSASVRAWAKAMGHACLGLAALLPIASGVRWLSADAATIAQSLGLEAVALGPLQRGLGLAIVLAPPAVHAVGLLHLRAAFRRFAGGEVFSKSAALALRRFSTAVLSACALSFLAFPILQLMLTVPTGKGVQWGVSVSTNMLSLLLTAGAVWVFAHVMLLSAQAHEEVAKRERVLADENAQFV
jgi:hypothetical protein